MSPINPPSHLYRTFIIIIKPVKVKTCHILLPYISKRKKKSLKPLNSQHTLNIILFSYKRKKKYKIKWRRAYLTLFFPQLPEPQSSFKIQNEYRITLYFLSFFFFLVYKEPKRKYFTHYCNKNEVSRTILLDEHKIGRKVCSIL